MITEDRSNNKKPLSYRLNIEQVMSSIADRCIIHSSGPDITCEKHRICFETIGWPCVIRVASYQLIRILRGRGFFRAPSNLWLNEPTIIYYTGVDVHEAIKIFNEHVQECYTPGTWFTIHEDALEWKLKCL
ncbi:MAG: hypothetical protein ACREAU_03580 [Nitrosopumilaceae archaeon]